MVPAVEYNDIIRKVSSYEEETKAIGVLIAKPQLPIVADEILTELNYYNRRAGKYIDIFMPGYSMFGRSDYKDDVEIGELDGGKIFYSNKVFCQFVDELEHQSKWQYDGETELLVIDATNGRLDYKNCLRIYFEKAIRVKAINSIRSFMESLIRLSKAETFTSDIQEKSIAKSIAFSAVEAFVAQIPYGIGETIKKNEVFKMCNYNKY